MKKILTMSLVAAMTVAGNAFAENVRISDVVRAMEDNPEYIQVASDAIVARAVLKNVSLKKIDAVNSVSKLNPGSTIKVVKNPVTPSIVQYAYTYDQVKGFLAARNGDRGLWCSLDNLSDMASAIDAAIQANTIRYSQGARMMTDINSYASTVCGVQYSVMLPETL